MEVYEIRVNIKEYNRPLYSHLYKDKSKAEDCKKAYEDGTIPLLVSGESCKPEEIDDWFIISLLTRQVI